jgi:hypothetical protein
MNTERPCANLVRELGSPPPWWRIALVIEDSPIGCGLFNSSLEGNTRCAIDVHEGDKIYEKALKAPVRAVALNTSARAAARSHPP